MKAIAIHIHVVRKSTKQNVSFEFLNLGIFYQFLSIKLTGLVTLFDRKLQIFKNSLNRTNFGIFY